MADPQVEPLIRAALGNPLALLELPVVSRQGGEHSEDLKPSSGAVEKVFRARVERLPDQTRRVLLLAAADDGGGFHLRLNQRLAAWPPPDMRSLDIEVAVLAIDPSSPFTGGAILGDRVRMQDHATDPGVFIRSMATRGHLGGLALATPEAVRLLDAIGRRWILVETVGVGQVEVEIAGKADTTVVVLNPGWGDSVQANKAGLMEIADVFAINKADRKGVEETRRDLEQMLDLSELPADSWRPPILATVATTGDGVPELWEAINAHRAHAEASGQLGVAPRVPGARGTARDRCRTTPSARPRDLHRRPLGSADRRCGRPRVRSVGCGRHHARRRARRMMKA